MSYEPYTWKGGDEITVAKMNHIEQGLTAESDGTYEPTVWITGDTVTAAKLNKIEQGIANISGGTKYVTLFDGEVTTAEGGDAPAPVSAPIVELVGLEADTIKVTFNGTEYTCGRTDDLSYGAPFIDSSTPTFDFSEYPFSIAYNNGYVLLTPDAGTYTLKIEEPQSSVLSLARINVEYVVGVPSGYSEVIAIYDDRISVVDLRLAPYFAVLYNGEQTVWNAGDIVSVSGNASLYENELLITGDCTITVYQNLF